MICASTWCPAYGRCLVSFRGCRKDLAEFHYRHHRLRQGCFEGPQHFLPPGLPPQAVPVGQFGRDLAKEQMTGCRLSFLTCANNLQFAFEIPLPQLWADWTFLLSKSSSCPLTTLCQHSAPRRRLLSLLPRLCITIIWSMAHGTSLNKFSNKWVLHWQGAIVLSATLESQVGGLLESRR